MTTIRMALIAILLAFAIATASAQNSPTGSPTPPAPGKAQGADVLWYGKAPPGWGGVVTAMKQLAPGVGWALRGGRLYWTTDNGANWKDITPPLEAIGGIFFLDAHTGWVTSAGKEPTSDDLPLDIASTADAGATWSVTHITLSLKHYDIWGNGTPGSHEDLSRYEVSPIAFVDRLHGWMGVQLEGLTMHSWANLLFVTSDGGKSWRPTSAHPILEDAELLLVSRDDGWMVGAQESPNDTLYVTHDGAKTWKEVSLPAPKEILLLDQAGYDLPVFEDPKHGFIAVTYTHGDVSSAAVLFATADGGRTWHPDRILRNLEGGTWGETVQSAVADSTWITAASFKDHGHPKLNTLSRGTRVNANIYDAHQLGFDAHQLGEWGTHLLSFVSPKQGWVIVGDGYLMSTTDGGATWTNITPGPKPHVIQPRGSVQGSALPRR
jgi:hypothetical protein